MDPDDPAYPGQAEYKPWLLAIYDPWVLGFMARAVWRSPTGPFVDTYRTHMGRKHLDVGPGTGYFLEKAAAPGSAVTILDPNPHVLRHVTRRLSPTMEVSAVEADVLKPLPLDGTFDSAALSFVLHCLPGPQERKEAAIRNIASVLEPDGVLFGGTVLGVDEPHTPQARAVLRAFNRQGGFDNLGDTVDGLHQIFDRSFDSVDIDVVGSCAFFVASRPR